MRFERRGRIGHLHVRHETHVDLGHRAMRQDGLAARTGVAADEAFDVHRRLRLEPLVRLLPGKIVDPVLHAEGLLRLRLAALRGGRIDHRLFVRAQRPRSGVVVDGDGVAVGGDKRVERVHEMPRRTVHHRFE